MKYLKNIKSLFFKKKSEEILYKEISFIESLLYKQEHVKSNFYINEVDELKKRKLALRFNKDNEWSDPLDCNTISTNNFEITKFDDEWYIIKIFFDDDSGECFLCDTWDGVRQLLDRK